MNDFAIEIGGWLDKFGKRGDLEGRVLSDFAVGKVTGPAGFQHPGFFGSQPARARGKNATTHFKRGGIEFNDSEPAKKILCGIEEIVIVDLGIVAEDPALRPRVGLRGAAFDLVTERVLALVGVREIGAVEEQQSAGKCTTSEEQRNGQAIEADAAGFESDDFVVLAHHADSDQHGDQCAERGELIEQIGNQVTEIVDDDEKGNAMARDVVEKLEEGEGLEKQDENAHDDGEVVEETAEYIEIHNGVDARRSHAWRFGASSAVLCARETIFGAGITIFRASGGGARDGFGIATAAKETPEDGKSRGDARGLHFTAIAFHARKQGQAGEGKNSVRAPHPEPGRDVTLASQSRTHDEEKVVGADDDDGEERARRASTTTRLCAERHGDQREYKTSDRESETLMEFDACFAPTFAAIVPEGGDAAFGIADGALFGIAQPIDFDRPVAAAKGGEGIVIGIGAGKFVGGAAVEVQLQLALLGIGNYNRAFR